MSLSWRVTSWAGLTVRKGCFGIPAKCPAGHTSLSFYSTLETAFSPAYDLSSPNSRLSLALKPRDTVHYGPDTREPLRTSSLEGSYLLNHSPTVSSMRYASLAHIKETPVITSWSAFALLCPLLHGCSSVFHLQHILSVFLSPQ